VDGTSTDSIFFRKRNSQKDKKMADLKIKLGLLASVAALCASSAFGQATLGTPTATTGFLRAEGTTERLPTTQVNISNAIAGTVDITVYVQPQLTITSKTYGTNKTSEIIAVANGGGGSVAGVVTGSQVAFTGITTTSSTTQITIDNIRVDATALSVAAGVPTAVSEQIFLQGASANPLLSQPFPVAYALPGLQGIKTTGTAASNTVCATVDPGTTQFTVNFAEGFAKAFKTATEETGTNGSALADWGTRIAITFSNVPANVTVYAPLTVTADTSGHSGVLRQIVSATAATADSNLAKAASSTLTSVGAVTITGGTGTVYYELYAGSATGLAENFPVAVSFASTGGQVAAQTAAIQATVSFAPIGAGANKVPNFVNGSSSATVTGSTYGPCATYLLFPYVTNAAGFETGIAISNTSLDNFGSKGASAAPTQSGTCTLNFYGNATASSNPAAATTASIAGGTVDPFTLTSVAGANFTGYMIANCGFQYAHGFAYIVYNFGTSSGAAMGYVASPFSSTGTSPRTLVTNGAESLGN
jgi:hypothetical protein